MCCIMLGGQWEEWLIRWTRSMTNETRRSLPTVSGRLSADDDARHTDWCTDARVFPVHCPPPRFSGIAASNRQLQDREDMRSHSFNFAPIFSLKIGDFHPWIFVFFWKKIFWLAEIWQEVAAWWHRWQILKYSTACQA